MLFGEFKAVALNVIKFCYMANVFFYKRRGVPIAVDVNWREIIWRARWCDSRWVWY